MNLHEYYEMTVNAEGKNQFTKADDPTPQDGYDRSPLVYVDPDCDTIEDDTLPFTGVDIHFMGDNSSVIFLPSGNEVTTELDEELENGVATAGAYYYRTGVYYTDENHTGFDAIVLVIPEFEEDDNEVEYEEVEYEDD